MNVYLKRSFQGTIELIRKKRMNAMNVILSVDEIETAENLINDANKINELKAVFLIYYKNKQFSKLSEAKENVIYTDCSSHIIEFAECRMNVDLIMKLTKKFEEKYKIKLNINRDKLSDIKDPLKKLANPDKNEEWNYKKGF